MKLAKYLLINVLILLVSLAMTVARAQQPVIESRWNDGKPVIDGKFQDTESWKDPQLELVDHFPVHAFVYFKNDDNDLFVMVDTPEMEGDRSQEVMDHCTIMIHNPLDGTELHIEVWGRDEVLLYKNDVRVQSLFIEAAAGFGESPNSPISHRIYEFKIPLAAITVTETGARWLHFASPETDFDSLPYDWNDGDPRINIWPKGAVPYNYDTWGILVLARERAPVGGEILSFDRMRAMMPIAVLGLALFVALAVRSRRNLGKLHHM